MADPAALGKTGISLAGAGSGISAMSKLLGANSSKQQYLYQSRIAAMNQQLAEQNAQWARTAGERENLQFGQRAGQRMGQIIAAQGASGIDVNSPGSQRVRTSQEAIDRADREQILENAARRAYSHDIDAYSKGLQTKMLKSAASNVGKAGWISAAASLVGGATSVADKWYQGNLHGMWEQPEDNSRGWSTGKFGA